MTDTTQPQIISEEDEGRARKYALQIVNKGVKTSVPLIATILLHNGQLMKEVNDYRTAAGLPPYQSFK